MNRVHLNPGRLGHDEENVVLEDDIQRRVRLDERNGARPHAQRLALLRAHGFDVSLRERRRRVPLVLDFARRQR